MAAGKGNILVPLYILSLIAILFYIGRLIWRSLFRPVTKDIDKKHDLQMPQTSKTDITPELKGRDTRNVPDSSHLGIFQESEVKTVDKSSLSEEDFYEKAFNEFESEDIKVGLWAKVFAEAQGDEALAKANYLKIRALQLAHGHMLEHE